jgi:hypothetical protein
MQEIFRANPDLKIITELYPYGLNNSGIQVSEFISSIKSAGFFVYKMSENSLSLLTDDDISVLNNEKNRIHLLDILLTKKAIHEAN